MRLRRTSIAVMITALAWAGFPGNALSQGEDLWDSGQNWLSFRAGYAKASGPLMGNGGVGFGVGYVRMLDPVKVGTATLFKHFSIGGYVHYEQIARFATAVDVEIPATIELVRHFRWRTALRPYLGFGAGAFYRKSQHTGADSSTIKLGTYLGFGANAPIGGRHLLGFDARWIRVDHSNNPANPVFGLGSAEIVPVIIPGLPPLMRYEQNNASHWSAKINYTIVY